MRVGSSKLVRCLSYCSPVLLAAAAGAQTFRGGINGSVVDPSGATVAGATVVAIDELNGVQHTSKTTGAGDFTFADLPLDRFTLAVTAAGFGTQRLEGVQVSQGSVYTAEIKLEVANAGAEVTVEADQLALDTTTNTLQTVLGSRAVDTMPLDGRDFTQMIAVTPGFAGYAIGGGGTGMGALNGTRFDQMNWQIDGVDNNDAYANVAAVNQGGILGIPGVVLPIDAIDQFSVQAQGNAEAGRNPGGVINLGLKSGGSSYHGTAYYFNRNEAFAARSPFLEEGTQKRANRNYNAGASLGGPVVRDKLFVFGSLETQTFTIGQAGLATEPSMAYQAQAKALLAKYGLTVNPVGQNILNTFYPAYALTGGAVANNYSSPVPQFGHSWNGLVKFDYAINAKNNLSLRGFGGEGNQQAPNGSQIDYYYEVGPIHIWNYALVLNTMLSSHFSNQVLVGGNYFNQLFNNADQNFNVAGTGLVTGSRFPTQAPKIRITGFDGVSVIAPSGRNDITGQIGDTLSYNVGKHAYRFGGEFRRTYVNIFNSGNSTGSFTFTGKRGPWAATNDTTYGTSVNALADLLIGQYATASMAIGNPEREVYSNSFDLFAQDAWRLSQRLTVNYGVRWDYQQPVYDSSKDLSVFVPGRGILTQGNGIASLFPGDWNNVAPRVGFSYELHPSTVLRGSVGLYYDQPALAPFLNNSTSNSSPLGVEANPGTSNPFFTQSISSGTIVSGVQVFNTSGTQTCTAATPCGVFSIDQAMRSPYTWEYNVQMEQALGSKVIFQAGYVGNESRKLVGIRDINQAATQSFGSPNSTAQNLIQQQSRPFYSQYPTYGNINQVGSFINGNYNSFQTVLKLQGFHGLTAQAVYTWAHALDEGSRVRSRLPQDSTNIRGEYGNTDTDTRHAFALPVTYTPPQFHGRGQNLLNGWQINGMLTLHTGAPFTIFNGSDTSGTSEGAQRVDVIGDAYRGVAHSFNSATQSETWFNPNAFVSPANGAFGNMRRNELYGPGYSDVDLSFFKTTSITERLKIQLRAEMFNLVNRKNFAPPDNTLGDSAFGTLYDTIGDYSGAPGIGPGEPFSMQLGGKIIF